MITVILTIYGSNSDRVGYLVGLLRRLQLHKGIEVILVEQYEDIQLWDWVTSICPLIYVPIKGDLFNLSWCRNVGARTASGDILVMMDADMFFGVDYFEYIKQVTTYSIGWDRLFYLTWLGSQSLLAGVTKEGLIEEQLRELVTRFRRSSCEENGGDCWADFQASRETVAQGGINVFNREWYFEVLGGYCEDFQGWGGEDTEIMNRATALTGEYYKIPCTVLHLHHYRGASIPGPYNSNSLQMSMSDPIGTAEKLVKLCIGNPERPTFLYV